MKLLGLLVSAMLAAASLHAAAFEKEAVSRTAKVQLSAEKPLVVGNNIIDLRVSRNAEVLPDAEVVVKAFMPAMPEIFLLTMVCAILIIDLFLKDESRGATYILSLIALATTALLSFSGYSQETITSFNGSFILDPMASILKIAICIIVIAVFIYAKD
ncbi:MAG: hypothetical protein DSZ03_07910, partial [Sulfurimonas sp.]